MATKVLLNAVTSAQTGLPTSIESSDLTSATGKTIFQVTSVNGAGAVSVVLEGSLDQIGWVPLATVDITAATGVVTDGAFIETLWLFLRARATAVPAGAAVTATVFRG